VTATRFDRSGPLRGELTPPADKSISHRAALLAAMCDGETVVHNYLDAADTRSTLAAIARVGAEVEEDGDALRIDGVGLRGAAGIESPIDVGNAGTLMRLLPGWLAGQPRGEWTLDGDDSIRRRPVDRIAEPLRMMGATVECRDERLPPLTVRGRDLIGIDYRLPVASAQVKSCVLLAGVMAAGQTTVTEPGPSRDHTERMLRLGGARVEVASAGTPVTIRGELPARSITVHPADRLELGEIEVPADFSSAAFFLAAAAIVSGSEVRLQQVGINPTRIGLLGVLTRMGAAVEVIETAPAGAEPRATIVARRGPLEAVRVGGGEIPLTIDELPLVALLGCFAEGTTVVSGAEELRHKESDRIATVVDGLAGLGAEIEASDDGFAVTGTAGLRGGVLDSHGDHRLAMLGALAGLASREGVEVRDFGAAAVSYPGFEADLRGLLRG
jgi:3-phosphoshikimate 1-carboxyvinyltransferase